MTPDKIHFVVVDDSKLDCFIAEKVILSTANCASVKTFMLASEALDYINSDPFGASRVVILVDIQMPIMNGFEFIETLETKLSTDQKKRYIIHLLSSSINESDMLRANSFQTVKSFLNKPLTKASLEQMLNSL